jgi:vacuolar-type H+-ATPase subunit I/STV1
MLDAPTEISCICRERESAPIFSSFGKLNPRGVRAMRFARIVFWVAGIWGLLMITPLYFIFDQIGEKDPPPITHPAFFYGFAGVALVWQIAFIFIAWDPVRFRPMMIPAILEKLVYSIPVLILVLQKRTRPFDLLFAVVDLSLGVLFVLAYLRTPRSSS